MTFNRQVEPHILGEIPSLYRGPGGAIVVLKDGELIDQHVWGYADINRRIPMTSDTLMPICSITKQMLCMTMTDLERNPTPQTAELGNLTEKFAEKLRSILPQQLQQESDLALNHLRDNQSGIRDYWATSTLLGALPERQFSRETDAKVVLDRFTTLQFQPGAQYSYSNTNFHVLGRVLEEVTSTPLEKLLAQHVFAPAGMKTAHLCAKTAEHPEPCIGYEGDEQHGFFPASNAIEWAGDAGVVASLADMVAYEKYFDGLWSDPQSWYRPCAESQKFNNGNPARYRSGLFHVDVEGVATVGHGGALRGYRLHRMYAPQERVSVVVLFNHEADAGDAAEYILRKILTLPEPEASTVDPDPQWLGNFLDRDTQLAVTVSPGKNGKLSINFTGDAEEVRPISGIRALSRGMVAAINWEHLSINRTEDNLIVHADRLFPPNLGLQSAPFLGDYRCADLDSVFHCEGKGEMLYGAFDGILGQGPAHLMRYLGGDVWALACPRGLDAPAPGNWTLVFSRDENDAVTSVTIGCWLARKFEFVRI